MKCIFALLICFAILLISCSNTTGNRWEPQVASAKIEPYAKQAISIIDQYLDFEIIKAAKEGFHEVLSRIDVADYEIFSPEETVYSTIMDVCLDAEDLMDTDFRMYRDILCFQIGEPVSGDSYTPTADLNDDSSIVTYIAKTLDLEAYPAKSIWISESYGDSSYYVSLTFDVMNGVSPEDVCQWCLDIMDAVKQSGAKVSTVYTDYEIYGQASFTMSSFYLATSGENIIALYDPEGNTLADSDSTPDVEAIIEIAKEYVKNYAE